VVAADAGPMQFQNGVERRCGGVGEQYRRLREMVEAVEKLTETQNCREWKAS